MASDGGAATLHCLPRELLTRILSEPVLEHVDVVNAGRSCRPFASVLAVHRGADSVWKSLIRNRFAGAYEVQQTETWHLGGARPADFGGDWRRAFVAHYRLRRAVDAYLAELEAEYLMRHTGVVLYSAMENRMRWWLAATGESEHDVRPLTAILTSIIYEQPWNHKLTSKFYARQLFDRLVSRCWLNEIFAGDSLEHVVWLVSHYIGLWSHDDGKRPAGGNERLSLLLDAVAGGAMQRLQTTSKPIADRIAALAPDQDCVWSDASYGAIVSAIFYSMAHSSLKGDTENDTVYDTQRLCPLYCLANETAGRPITLCIIMLLTAKRLRFVMEPINLPNRFVLRFSNACKQGAAPTYSYVDAWRQAVMSENELVRWHRATMHNVEQIQLEHILRGHPASIIEVVQRIVNNVLSAVGDRHDRVTMRATELLLELNEWRNGAERLTPDPHGGRAGWRIKKELAAAYIDSGTNLDRVEWMLGPLRGQQGAGCPFMSSVRDIAIQLPAIRRQFGNEDVVAMKDKKSARCRSPVLHYAAGMVMRHRRYDYRCVIYGWDRRCSATAQWQQQMNVHALPLGASQPFYNVLVDDGTCRYAAQENLEPIMASVRERDLRPVRNWLAPKYFDSYHADRYNMNSSHAGDYPDDWHACQLILDTFYNTNGIAPPKLP